MNALLHHIETQGDNVVSFWLRPEHTIHFIAGQYIELYLPHDHMDSRGSRRWFTISSSPDDELIALTTGFPAKPSSFKQQLRVLPPGAQVIVSDPLGDFVLLKDRSVPLVFIAAGTGSTPYASMIKWLITHNETRQIELIYAASNPDAFLFNDLWEAYEPLHVTRMISSAHGAWHEHIGHLNATMVLKAIEHLTESAIYLAGPQSLIEPLYEELLAHVQRSRILLGTLVSQ
jgi:ferredoxin-NADP reductase